jgi:hypothetical protein
MTWVHFRGALLALGVVLGALGCEGEDPRADGGEPDVEVRDSGSDDSGVQPCSADHHVLDGACVACPDGTFHGAGDDPRGPDTFCEPIVCAAGERVASHFCVPCPPGSFGNLAGDDASGPDTTCDGGFEAAPPPEYDPLAMATDTRDSVRNLEAAIPVMCYTSTEGRSNPCWVCHTQGSAPVAWIDWDLQEAYAFSDEGLENHWVNVFEDRTERVAAISEEAILDYIRTDNYTPLMEALGERTDGTEYLGYVPDLDFRQGFDDEGFAHDGSGWRALRYKPFPGSFWPTNGSTDDVFIRLPATFRETRELYKINLAILEAVVASDPTASDPEIVREVEPISEVLAGFDLDGDGTLSERITEIRGMPAHYAGAASEVVTLRGTYPQDTEYLHSVRYVDPDAPGMIAARMKELRYSRNTNALSVTVRNWRFEVEDDAREDGLLPEYGGSGVNGMIGTLGWRLQGFIEDENGWLRAQTDEETRFCMGCHGLIGAVVDGTFTLPRKLPGAAGWRYQTIEGIFDVPQAGHEQPEILTYFERNRAADELRANTEMLERFFDAAGNVDRTAVLRAAPGGDRDLAWLLGPSRERALTLNRAYRTIVIDQDFVHGRDANVAPLANVHASVENGDTELGAAENVYRDGVMQLDWGWLPSGR